MILSDLDDLEKLARDDLDAGGVALPRKLLAFVEDRRARGDDDLVELAYCVGAECLRAHGIRLATYRGTGPSSIYVVCDECYAERLTEEERADMVALRGAERVRQLGLHEMRHGRLPDDNAEPPPRIVRVPGGFPGEIEVWDGDPPHAHRYVPTSLLLTPVEGIDLDAIRDRAAAAQRDAALHVSDDLRAAGRPWAAKLMASLVATAEDVVTLLDCVRRVRAERDEARAWVRRLTASARVLTCAFCGEAYPPGTPETNHERLTAHVKVCPKHPMREVEARAERAEKALGHARKAVGRALAAIGPAPSNDGEAVKILPAVEDAWDVLRVALGEPGVPDAIRARVDAALADATLERVAQLLGPVGTPFASMQRVKRARELLAAALGRVGSTSASACSGSGLVGPLRRGIYIASKTAHASRWRDLRAKGAPIISTWIDEAEPGETTDRADLWTRCIREAASASALILYRADASEEVKGALAEAGAALAAGVPVWWVGPVHTLSDSIYTVIEHPLVRRGSTLEEAFEAAVALAGEAPP